MITDFIFDGMALSDFGYILFFEESDDSVTVSNMEFGSIKAARSDAHQKVSYSYNDNYSCEFTIMKNICMYDEEETFLTNKDVSEMVRWLSCKEYKWFRLVDDKDDDDEIWYKAQIQISKEYAGDRVFGLKLTVNTNTPYGYTKEYTKTKVLDYGDVINIPLISDEYIEIYPDVTITLKEAGAVVLGSWKNTFHLYHCIQGEVITITGGNTRQISSTNPDHDWEKDFNFQFPVLIRDDDVSGGSYQNYAAKCEVTITYRGIRKVGLG